MRWLGWALWPLFLFQNASAATPSSTALAEARDCMLRGGKLDLFKDGGSAHTARCRFTPCPALSTEIFYSCVAPELASEAREIALTLHVPCSHCAQDNGVEVAGQVWMALAAALQIPLQEIQVSVLLMREQLWQHYPLQHFTLTHPTEAPMVTPNGGWLAESATDLGERWDFFMAVRIHSTRIDPSDASFLEIMGFQPQSIQEAAAISSPINVFEAVQRKTTEVLPLSPLSAVFKIRGLDWGEEPPHDAGLPSEPQSGQNQGSDDPRRPPSVATTAPPVSSTARNDFITTTVSTSPMVQVTPQPTPIGCRCRSAWLGDGFCDDYCNIEVCEWDRGDCGTPTGAGQNAGNSQDQVTWPNGYYSPSTSEWEGWPGSGGEVGRSPIVDLSASDRESILHIDASAEGNTDPWRADESMKEYGESPGISPVLIVGLSLLGCIVPIACCFARRPMRQSRPASKGSWGFGLPEKVEDEERGIPGNRGNLPRTFSSQYSDETTDTGGSSPHSGSWGFAGVGARKEMKVHPAPEEEQDIRNSRGDWRRSHSHPPAHGPRPEAASGSWQVPQQPAPGNWHQRQEQERQRRQREKEDHQKSQRQQTRADQDAWQQEWIKNKREQDRLEKELKQQEEEQQKRQRKEAQRRQQEEEERQRKWHEQEEQWKKQAEELRREKEKQEEQEYLRQKLQEEQRRCREQEQQRQKAEKQRQQEQQRQQQQQQQRGREQQRKDQKQEKADGERSRGGFFGRWRAKSEPAKEQKKRDGPQASAPKGSQWTRWPGADMPRAASTEDKARSAKETEERAAREKMQKAAEHKASSLMDTVMKQIDRTRSSPLEERKKVFRDLQRQLHPDKNLHDQEAAKLAFQKLMESRDSYLS